MVRKYYAKKKGRGKPVRYSRSKKLVTGHGPTMLEKIASGAGSVAKLAMAVAPAIAAINTEHKYFDRTGAVIAHSPGTSDVIVNLTGAIPQAITDSGRIGNSILAKDLQLRLANNFQATTGAPNVMGIHCRMLLVCWKEDESVNAITAAKLFESPSNLYSPVNKDNSDQFVILKDKFFSMNSTVGLTANTAFQTVKLYKALNWHMRWNNTVSTQNHVFLVLRSSAAGATNALQTTYYSRLNYTDN